MVTKVVHDVTDSISDAFTFQNRTSTNRDEMLRQIREVRRMAAYNRNQLLRENRQRREAPISTTDIEAAVIRAIQSSRSKDEHLGD